MYKFILKFALLISSALFVLPTWASQPVGGCFTAKQACPALRSIRKNTNPNQVMLQKGKQYKILAKNKVAATHYLLDIPNVKEHRWATLECGVYSPTCSGSVASPENAAADGSDDKPEYILALSWQPTFCESHRDKAECKTLNDSRYDAKNLAIHGLWPQPRNNAYCNVSDKDKAIDRRGRWDLLPVLPLSEETRQRLAIAMPGYTSLLQRHEWVKHGTCFAGTADQYYQITLGLADVINQSAVGDLFKKNIGKNLSANDVRQAFDQSFGEETGKRVKVLCDRKSRLGELFISLKGDLSLPINKETVTKWLEQGAELPMKCKAGLVDPT